MRQLIPARLEPSEEPRAHFIKFLEVHLIYSALTCELAAEQSVDGVLDDFRIPLEALPLLAILKYNFISSFSHNSQPIRIDNLSVFLNYLRLWMLFRPSFELL